MRLLLRKLFIPEEAISGKAFCLWGVALFCVKYLIDFLLATVGFGLSWWPTDYLIPRPGRLLGLSQHPPDAAVFAMVCIAVPFVWIGVNLSLRRLRTLGWSPAWVACFFIPYINLLFFAVLSLHRINASAIASEPLPANILPSHRHLVLFMSLTAASVVCITLAATVFRSYGFGLFLGVPFVIGFIAGLLSSAFGESSIRAAYKLAFATLTLASACLLGLAIEGFICLIMAAPIAVILAAIGVFFGLAIRRIPFVASGRAELSAAAFFVLPFLIAGESRLQLAPTVFKVTSSIVIDAPPTKVWSAVVSFPELPPPTELLFRCGLAYPIRADIEGSGAGAIRRCVFNTGAFIEPITVWDEPSLLRFSVTSNPPPLQELAFAEIDPPHLHGFFISEQGQFELKPLPAGQTELIGTTWYKHSLWPELYWRLWSDHVIHTIHLRVLRHIKIQAER